MRSDSADAIEAAIDEALAEAPSSSEAEALAAIHASWQDETERTDVMQPHHLASHFAPAPSARREDATSRHVAPPPRTADDPHWDDEAELTNALDFEALAPWHVPSGSTDGDPSWEVAVTNRLEPVAPARPLPAAVSGKHRAAEPDHSVDPGWLNDLLSPLDVAAQTASGVQALNLTDLTPSPVPGRLLEAAPWPARPTRNPGPARAGARPARSVARRSFAPPAQHVQPDAQPAYESQAVRKSQVARAQVARPTAQSAREVPPVFAAPRPSQLPLPSSSQHPQPMAAGRRTGASTLPARGRLEPACSEPPVPAWITQSRAPAPVFNPPSFEAAFDDAPLSRGSRAASSWLWLSAGAALALVVAFGFRLWTEVTSDLRAPAEVAVSAATAPIDHALTGFSIASRPAGAQVFVDGKATGLITPARVRQLSPGLHAIDLKMPGYFDTSLPAVLADGSTLELPEVDLRPLVVEEPPAAVAAGDSERQLKAAKSKSRRYRARRHAKTEIASIENTPLGSVPVAAAEATAEAEPAPAATGEGVLQINSRPWARVLIDDKFVGNTPQRALRLPAGRHVVRLVNEPLNMSKTFTVDIRDGETTTKVETLNEQPAQSGVSTPQHGESAVAQVLRMRVD